MLCKDKSKATLAGVCSGLAKHFGCDPFWIRLIFVIGVLHLGIGVLLYIILALLMPTECD
jgi:phage shock protein PspC (stress-responsive transcriptional regulator)